MNLGEFVGDEACFERVSSRFVLAFGREPSLDEAYDIRSFVTGNLRRA